MPQLSIKCKCTVWHSCCHYRDLTRLTFLAVLCDMRHHKGIRQINERMIDISHQSTVDSALRTMSMRYWERERREKRDELTDECYENPNPNLLRVS